ncbi:Fic family protein [Sinirhodobacter huangdaonensis]|uniref:Fic family protein n=1 Tax=Paenirhodobacter huangdaonensis TaxID=2501515 RepID=A0A443LFR8_9RHOB|nr:Fic family protein [Sinirhodobacter huangdaonensis]
MLSDERRHSQAEEVGVVDGEEARARTEAANGLRQAERVIEMVMSSLERHAFKLRPSTILDLHREAIQGLSPYAGNWRPGDVAINLSSHLPPLAGAVPYLVEELCDYVSEKWDKRTAIHLASFVMWRLNWIHPFTDGNGRTSRAVSYLVLCCRSRALLPGANTIPEQVVRDRAPYYSALEAADARLRQWKSAQGDGFPDDIVREMEELMAGMLARQLRDVFDEAKGDLPG